MTTMNIFNENARRHLLAETLCDNAKSAKMFGFEEEYAHIEHCRKLQAQKTHEATQKFWDDIFKVK